MSLTHTSGTLLPWRHSCWLTKAWTTKWANPCCSCCRYAFPLSYRSFLCLSLVLPFLTSPFLALQRLFLPCIALPCIAFPPFSLFCLSLPYLSLHCLALPYLALPCLALPCIAVPFLASPCLVLSCLAIHLLAQLCIAFYLLSDHQLCLAPVNLPMRTAVSAITGVHLHAAYARQQVPCCICKTAGSMPTSLVHYLCLLLLPINSLRLLAYALAFALSHCMHPLTGIASCIMWRQTALKAAVCHLCQLSTSEELSHLFLCPSAKSQSLRGTLWARGWGERRREGEEGGCSYWQMHSHSGRQGGGGKGGAAIGRCIATQEGNRGGRG